MEKKVEIKDNKVFVTTTGLKLTGEKQREVGERTMIDIYNKTEMLKIKESLENDMQSLLKQKEAVENQIEESSKAFNQRDINKLKEFIAKSQAAASYNKYNEQVKQRDSVLKSIEYLQSEIDHLKDIE
jgi:hypothetical protein